MKKSLINCVGSSKGHFSKKDNRAQKLIDSWNDVHSKMVGFLKRGGGKTTVSRCAYGVLIILETGMRVGNETSAEGYTSINKYSGYYNKVVKTYGLTTLLKKHTKVRKGILYINFLGKKQVEHELKVKNPLLVKYYKNVVSSLEKDDLFLGVDYYTFQKFVRKYIGRKFSPKDLRTAFVNNLFLVKFDFRKYLAVDKRIKNKVLSDAIEETAEIVGHTKSVCRSAYISKHLINTIKNS